MATITFNWNIPQLATVWPQNSRDTYLISGGACSRYLVAGNDYKVGVFDQLVVQTACTLTTLVDNDGTDLLALYGLGSVSLVPGTIIAPPLNRAIAEITIGAGSVMAYSVVTLEGETVT